MPEKKLSYNEHKKKSDLHLKSDKYHRHIDNSTLEIGVHKKRSGQYEKTFFR